MRYLPLKPTTPLILLAICFAVSAADIRLTLDNNLQLVLHDDYTWSCGSKQDRERLEQMTITLNDGQEVHLAANGTWRFIVPDGTASEGLTMLYHSGLARSSDAKVAGQHARRLAMDGLVKRVRAGTGADIEDSELRACIEGMDKRVERKENCADGMCEVKITITIEKEAIEGIKECIALSKRLQDRENDSAGNTTVK